MLTKEAIYCIMIQNTVVTKQTNTNCTSATFFFRRPVWSQSLCQPITHDWKPKLQTKFPPLPPKCWKDAHIWPGDFPWPYYFITKEDEESCLWLPTVLGWLFLAKRLESREFPQGEHPLLCKRKLNYVITGPSCSAHELSFHHHLSWWDLDPLQK